MEEKELFSNKILSFLAKTVLLSLTCCLILNGTMLIDEFEHLRASYLITLGFTPYTDFFEHHHPFLWWFMIKKHQATFSTHIFTLILTADLIKNAIFFAPFSQYFIASALAVALLSGPIIYQAGTTIRNCFAVAVVILNLINTCLSLLIFQNSKVLCQINYLSRWTPSDSWSIHSEILDIYSTYFP